MTKQKLKDQVKKLIDHLETAMDVIQDEYGISQEDIDREGAGNSLNRGNSIYGQLGEMQKDIEIGKKMLVNKN